jgi:NAD(P)H dehydrogenase (quinone)
MFVVTGITGQVGSHVAHTLLAAQQPVRAVMRNPDKAEVWRKSGCEIALAVIYDSTALAKAFMGAEGVFILVPPNFDPAPGFPEAQTIAASLRKAIELASPQRIVYLSTVVSTVSSSKLLVIYLLSRFCDPRGLWKIQSGMWLQRRRV